VQIRCQYDNDSEAGSMTILVSIRNISDLIKLFRSKAFDGMDNDDYTATNFVDAISNTDHANHQRIVLVSDALPIFDEFVGWFMCIADVFAVAVISSGKRSNRKVRVGFIVVAAIRETGSISRPSLSTHTRPFGFSISSTRSGACINPQSVGPSCRRRVPARRRACSSRAEGCASSAITNTLKHVSRT
jgi:hypothetical protein